MTSLQGVSPISSYNPIQALALASAWSISNLVKTSLVALGVLYQAAPAGIFSSAERSRILSHAVPAPDSGCLDQKLFRRQLTDTERSIQWRLENFGLWDPRTQERAYTDFDRLRAGQPNYKQLFPRLGPRSEHLEPCGEQEYFRLQPSSEKSKSLHLLSNDAPDFESVHYALLGREYDVKIKEIKSLGQICKETGDAASIGKLELLHLHIHGRPDALLIPDANVSVSDDFSCLSKVDPEGVILLTSCSTGGAHIVDGIERDNIAQTIANQSGRRVIAPIDDVNVSYLEWKSYRPLDIFHPGDHFSDRHIIVDLDRREPEELTPAESQNTFKEFLPRAVQ